MLQSDFIVVGREDAKCRLQSYREPLRRGSWRSIDGWTHPSGVGEPAEDRSTIVVVVGNMVLVVDCSTVAGSPSSL